MLYDDQAAPYNTDPYSTCSFTDIPNDTNKLINRSFSDHLLWYQKRLTNTEDLPLSKYDKSTKKIFIWNSNWPVLPQ